MSDTFYHDGDAFDSLGDWVDWGDREPEYYVQHSGRNFVPDELYYHHKYTVSEVKAETEKALLLKLKHLEGYHWVAKSLISGFKGTGECYIHKIFAPLEED